MMQWLRSALFALLFYPGTLLYVLTVFSVSPFGERPVQAVVHGWSDFHHWLVRHVLRVRFQLEGSIPDGAYLIAVKHQAMVETIEALRLADTPVVVMKRELTVIPLFGWVTRCGAGLATRREAGRHGPERDGQNLNDSAAEPKLNRPLRAPVNSWVCQVCE